MREQRRGMITEVGTLILRISRRKGVCTWGKYMYAILQLRWPNSISHHTLIEKSLSSYSNIISA